MADIDVTPGDAPREGGTPDLENGSGDVVGAVVPSSGSHAAGQADGDAGPGDAGPGNTDKAKAWLAAGCTPLGTPLRELLRAG